MSIYSFFCCALLLCTPVPAGQSKTFHMRVENRADVPVRVLSAHISIDSSGEMALYVTVQNIGASLIRAFSVVFPDGPRRFVYSVEPGQISEFVEYASATETKKASDMVLRGELESWIAKVADFQPYEEHSRVVIGLPIRLDLAAISETASDVTVSFPAERDFFLDESEESAAHIHGPRVLGYVRTYIEICNASKEFVREIQYRFEAAVGKEWKEIGAGTVLAMLPSGDSSLAPMVVPAEILEGSARLRLQQIRLVITKVFRSSDQPSLNDSQSVLPRHQESNAAHFGVLSFAQAAGASPNIVDQPPVPLNRDRAIYTEEALQHKVQGVVQLKALVDVDGSVKQIKIIKHLPHGLDEEALAAAYKIKFKPALKGGKPVIFWQVIDVAFTI